MTGWTASTRPVGPRSCAGDLFDNLDREAVEELHRIKSERDNERFDAFEALVEEIDRHRDPAAALEAIRAAADDPRLPLRNPLDGVRGAVRTFAQEHADAFGDAGPEHAAFIAHDVFDDYCRNLARVAASEDCPALRVPDGYHGPGLVRLTAGDELLDALKDTAEDEIRTIRAQDRAFGRQAVAAGRRITPSR